MKSGSGLNKWNSTSYINNTEHAHVPAVTRVIQMQQDRLNPAVTKTEAKHLHLHVVSPEIIHEVDRDFENIMKSAQAWGKAAQVIDAESVTNGA